MLGNAASFASAYALPLTAAYMGYKTIPGLVNYKDKDSSWGSLDEYGDKMLMRKRSKKGGIGRFFENMSHALSDVAPMSIRGLLGGEHEGDAWCSCSVKRNLEKSVNGGYLEFWS